MCNPKIIKKKKNHSTRIKNYKKKVKSHVMQIKNNLHYFNKLEKKNLLLLISAIKFS